MTMTHPRTAIRLLARADAFGVREELVGDVLEEIGRGRSDWWVWRQVIGLYALAWFARLRNRRLAPWGIACALCLAMLAAASIGSASRVLQVWLGVYYLAGMASLFAHMASHMTGARTRVTSQAP
jgi:hypothetical protein